MSAAQYPNQPAGPGTGQPAGLRIGDADRDRAVNALSEHLASGRLNQSEFDERMTAAFDAKTRSDLEPLFLDLPGPRPIGSAFSPAAQARPTHPPYDAPARTPTASQVPLPRNQRGGGSSRYPYALGPAIWLVALALMIFSGGHLWWLLLVAMFVSSGLWGGCNKSRTQRQHQR